MKLPRNFQFNQSNLQDYVDCRRRFLLKHIAHLSWPAVEVEPIRDTEKMIELGTRFHHMAHQLMIGLPVHKIEIPPEHSELITLWENFLNAIGEQGVLHPLIHSSLRKHPEVSLTGSLSGAHLVAKIDLITVHADGSIKIYDWKTSSVPPRRSKLAENVQTKIYPYLLTQSGDFINDGRPIAPEQVEMIYWVASSPNSPISFSYNQEKYRADEAYIKELIETIQRLGEEEFQMTSNKQRCSFCAYRSFCNRGFKAGQLNLLDTLSEEEESLDLSLDIEQVEEIDY